MTAVPPPPHRTARERLAAWLVMGPLGHLWSTCADLALFGARMVLRARSRRAE